MSKNSESSSRRSNIAVSEIAMKHGHRFASVIASANALKSGNYGFFFTEFDGCIYRISTKDHFHVVWCKTHELAKLCKKLNKCLGTEYFSDRKSSLFNMFIEDKNFVNSYCKSNRNMVIK